MQNCSDTLSPLLRILKLQWIYLDRFWGRGLGRLGEILLLMFRDQIVILSDDILEFFRRVDEFLVIVPDSEAPDEDLKAALRFSAIQFVDLLMKLDLVHDRPSFVTPPVLPRSMARGVEE